MGRIWTKVGYRLHINKQSILENHMFFRNKRTPIATIIEDADSVLLKHQKVILNCWKKYVCELLKSVTVQYLETSEEQIGEEIYCTEAEVSTAIKFLEAGKATGENDI